MTTQTETPTATLTPPLIHRHLLIRNIKLAMRPDLQTLLVCKALSRPARIIHRRPQLRLVRTALAAPKPREPGGRTVQTAAGGILVAAAAVGIIVGGVVEEGIPVKQTTAQRPGLRDIGDDDGGCGFADVPVEPFHAVGLGDGVDLGKDRAEDDEGAQGEDGAEDDFPGEGEFGADEQRQRDGHDHDVG